MAHWRVNLTCLSGGNAKCGDGFTRPGPPWSAVAQYATVVLHKQHSVPAKTKFCGLFTFWQLGQIAQGILLYMERGKKPCKTCTILFPRNSPPLSLSSRRSTNHTLQLSSLLKSVLIEVYTVTNSAPWGSLGANSGSSHIVGCSSWRPSFGFLKCIFVRDVWVVSFVPFIFRFPFNKKCNKKNINKKNIALWEENVLQEVLEHCLIWARWDANGNQRLRWITCSGSDTQPKIKIERASGFCSDVTPCSKQ